MIHVVVGLVGDISKNSCRWLQIEIFIDMNMYKEIYIYVYIHFLFSQLWEPRRNDISVAMSTLTFQILVSNIILHEKEPFLLVEMADPRTGVRNMQDEPRSCNSIRK
jgi:hypothetical protein